MERLRKMAFLRGQILVASSPIELIAKVDPDFSQYSKKIKSSHHSR